MRSAPSRATPANSARHQRHCPEETTLYRLVQLHLDSFLAFVDTETGGTGLPTLVTDEFDGRGRLLAYVCQQREGAHALGAIVEAAN